MAEAGAAIVIGDEELDADAARGRGRRAARTTSERLAAMAAASAALAKPDAARRIADEVLEAAR